MRRNRREVVDLPQPLVVSARDRRALEALGGDAWLWVLEELSFAWREAQMEASLAYGHWCRMRDRTAYATYRAAQDRADAAQDALSESYARERC